MAKAKKMTAKQFKESNAALVARAEAAGIDWKKLLALFGPMLLALLEKLLSRSESGE